jgi:hypothetical protein
MFSSWTKCRTQPLVVSEALSHSTTHHGKVYGKGRKSLVGYLVTVYRSSNKKLKYLIIIIIQHKYNILLRSNSVRVTIVLLEGFEFLTAVIMKNPIFWDKQRIVCSKSTDVSEERTPYLFRVEECDLWNVGGISTDYIALYPRRQNSSSPFITIFITPWIGLLLGSCYTIQTLKPWRRC